MPEQRYNALASYETAIAALRCRHLGRLTLRQLAREWQLTLLALRIAALQRRLRLYITALAAAISVIMLAPAPARSGAYGVYGIGASSCATAMQNHYMWNDAVAWLAGYLTAVNSDFASQSGALFDIIGTAGTDNNGAYALLWQWCTNHPAASIAKAADAVTELLTKMGASRSHP